MWDLETIQRMNEQADQLDCDACEMKGLDPDTCEACQAGQQYTQEVRHENTGANRS